MSDHPQGNLTSPFSSLMLSHGSTNFFERNLHAYHPIVVLAIFSSHWTSFHLAVSLPARLHFSILLFCSTRSRTVCPSSLPAAILNDDIVFLSWHNSLLSAAIHRAPATTLHRPPYAKIARLTSISRPCVSLIFLPFFATEKKCAESTNSFSKAAKPGLVASHISRKLLFGHFVLISLIVIYLSQYYFTNWLLPSLNRAHTWSVLVLSRTIAAATFDTALFSVGFTWAVARMELGEVFFLGSISKRSRF